MPSRRRREATRVVISKREAIKASKFNHIVTNNVVDIVSYVAVDNSGIRAGSNHYFLVISIKYKI